MNPHVTPIEKSDSSILQQPSHAVLNHLGIRTTTSDGLLATTVTMRYKHKVVSPINHD
jgi:5'-AMP-activated protein kinase beta subunit, interaction domain